MTRNQSIEEQQQKRPLAKLQHDLEQMHEHRHDSDSKSESGSDDESDEEDNLLFDDDNELAALDKVLGNIHQGYYNLFDKDKINKPDLTEIIPSMKSKTLEGITVLFSGIIPLGINLDSADIVIWCRQFGVKVVNEVYPEVTHVVCRDVSEGAGPTFKTRVARKLYPDTIKIVNPDWLFACLSNWTKVDEKDYLISTDDTKLWTVKENEITKYQKALEDRSALANATHIDSIESFDEYDLDEANQEVDDFLAGLSDDDEEEEEEEEDEEIENPESNNDDEEIYEQSTNGHDSFIKDAYSKKRNRDEEEVQLVKKQKIENGENGENENENDLDDLEKELLDGFDDLEE